MPRNYSIFLDGLRLSAALIVLAGHLTQLSGGTLTRLPIEHDGVVIFFLLSGYVIGYCAHERETDLATFAIARIARVFSVAVPALLLTMALDRTGMIFNASAYPFAFEFRKWFLYLPLFWSFLSEIWLFKISAFSNTPYWSLVYEVWYYLLFASLFFFRGAVRLILGGAVFLVMGPKIWLLAPLWLAGYGLYRLHRRPAMAIAPAPALILAAIAVLAYGAVKIWKIDLALDNFVDQISGGWSRRSLSGSQFFLGDYIKGITIFLFLLAMRYCLPAWIAGQRVAGAIRDYSQFTFSLYLFHFPILVFLLAAFPPTNAADQLLRLGVVFAVVFTLGGWCERRKGALRRALARLYRRAGAPGSKSISQWQPGEAPL